MSAINHYGAYGLSIASQLTLPELIPITPPARADVTITLGRVPERLASPRHATPRVQVGDGVYQLRIDGVAHYRVEQGRSVVVEPEAGASPADVRLFLLGTVLGALLHQLGRLPLHASAVAVEGQAAVFCGPSGAGKSTLAAALQQRGMPPLGDDVGVVIPDAAGRPLFYPGLPRIKLWRDALEHFRIDHRILAGDGCRADKYHLQVHELFHCEPLPVGAIYILEWAEDEQMAAIHPLAARDALPLLTQNTYRPRLVERLGDARSHFLRCVDIAQAVRLSRYRRPRTLARLDESLQVLIDDLSR